MGASRKLQGEIDRVLKKVQEGVDIFDNIWNKVYDTDNVNLKEKFEADLKKEIKKLQRYRDQIKTWLQSNEIKDKKVSAFYEQALTDARKLIEREMERFKICEKEFKTKAFSKEGLEQQPKTDPKEKAKSETRDWLNNVVSELESQIDTFEAELEGLTVKKGKARPPRLTHLEASIVRHKAHIIKLELILRLLDNDELSPEEVNDVKDFLDDYVERNQEDFDEFSDVDELYSSLPLDKVESLEELVTTGPPALVKGVGVTGTTLSPKISLISPPAQQPATVQSPVKLGPSARVLAEETAVNDTSSEVVPRTPPAKNSQVCSSAPSGIGERVSASINAPTSKVAGASGTSVTLSGASSVTCALDDAGAVSSLPVNLIPAVKDEGSTPIPSQKSIPALTESGLRGAGRGPPNQASSTSLSAGIAVPGSRGLGTVPSPSETANRSILGADERLGDSGTMQPLVSPQNNSAVLPQAPKTINLTGSSDIDKVGEMATMSGRAVSQSVGSGVKWRSGSPFQGQNEVGQFCGRTEITPDQREKFLQRLQQVQQGQNNPLNMASLGGENHKQFSAQQNPPLQQSSSGLSHVGMGLGTQALGFNALGSSLQQANSIHQQQSARQALLSAGQKDAEVGLGEVEDTQQQKNLSVGPISEPLRGSETRKNLTSEDDLKANSPLDSAGGMPGSLAETVQLPMDTDFSLGQPLRPNQTSASLGVIGRKCVSDLGRISDNLGGPSASCGGMQDQSYNLQMLEAAYYKLPQPKDSERARTYVPRHPAVTPPSFPQYQAPILNNAALWERIGSDNNAIDILFFAFYYQQNTYQQYLAAKELKKQSWRYHRKYNTWFQRHEEPIVTTDEYEQGSYVYFDFHMTNDDMQHGWCQRIKTQFAFEYNHLEDELND